MQNTHQSSTARRNILVGLAVGTGSLAAGCGVPQPASLENSGMAGLDYSKLDYSKLDYSKLDPSEMGQQECDIRNVNGQKLSDELKQRLFKSLAIAHEYKLGDEVYSNIENTINALLQSDELFQEYNELLCW